MICHFESSLLLKYDELPYMKDEKMTSIVPSMNRVPGSRSFNMRYESNDERMIDIEVANPFRILSAYLTVRATTNPPTALN